MCAADMSPKFTTRIKNWVESRFGRGRRRPVRSESGPERVLGGGGGGGCVCGAGGGPLCRCGAASVHGCPLVVVSGEGRGKRYGPGRVVLTPDSLHSFSSPESAYFTGQSEDSGTPLTPATPITPATPSSGKYFLLQNRDFRPLRPSPEARASVRSVPSAGPAAVVSARTEYVTVDEFPEICCSPRERPKIKTNPWVSGAASGKPGSTGAVSDTSGLDCSMSGETAGSRRPDFHRSYSSGRSSYVSEVSSGGTLATAGSQPERSPRRDSTYDSLGSSRHRSSEEEVAVSARRPAETGDGQRDPQPTRRRASGASLGAEPYHGYPPPPAESYSDNATDDEDDTEDEAERGDRRSPSKRSRSQRQRQERRRSLRDRRRGSRRRSEHEFSPPTPSSPVLPDPSQLFAPAADRLHEPWPAPPVYENLATSLVRPSRSRGLRHGSAHLPRSFCPSSEPLRRKVFRPGQQPPASPLRYPADVVRPRSSLDQEPLDHLPGYSPVHVASPSARSSCRESLEQKIERLRRQRLIVEAKIEEAQAEEQQRRQQRLRQLAETLRQRRVMLHTLGHRYPSSAESSPYRQQSQSAGPGSPYRAQPPPPPSTSSGGNSAVRTYFV